MINQVYKLTQPKRISTIFEGSTVQKDEVIVRPLYMSICAADQRYYLGTRNKEVLAKKLPLALIHEAVGEVLLDASNTFEKGDKVVLIPNQPTEISSVIKENYSLSSKFRGSSLDGFMKNLVIINKNRLVNINKLNISKASMLELISVAINAVEEFAKKSHSIKDTIGVFGDGSVGYVTALVLKKYFPKSKIIIIGTSNEKLNYFSFATDTILFSDIKDQYRIDHAFECVGGEGARSAINKIIDIINPQGVISLMGVSEEPVGINTRMILEKGLTMIGNSRSSYEDFSKATELLANKNFEDYIDNIISETVEINNISDIHKAFENDLINPFKTVMKWNL